jgi:hypothetical protein
VRLREVRGAMLDRQRVRTFLLGGLAGVIAGMLFAPRSGKETRGAMTTGAGAARERGRETLFGTRERLEERLSARRYRSPREREARHAAPGAGDDRPTEAASPAAEPHPEPRPRLHEVPRRPVGEESGGAGGTGEAVGDPEELRRRILETRSRLRARLDEGRPSGNGPPPPAEDRGD